MIERSPALTGRVGVEDLITIHDPDDGDGDEVFVEGEPDLRAPEEEALEELDDETILEQELDNEDVLEQDVEEDVLEETLEDLEIGDAVDEVEAGTGDDAWRPGAPRAAPVASPDDVDDEEEEVAAEGDVEDALDQILDRRMAVDADAVGVWEDGADLESTNGASPAVRSSPRRRPGSDAADEDAVEPCGPEEFVCRGCYLVRRRELLADPVGTRCRDCAG